MSSGIRRWRLSDFGGEEEGPRRAEVFVTEIKTLYIMHI